MAEKRTEKREYKDFPFDDIVAAVEQHVAHGCTCFQKYTCEHCGKRQMVDAPNMFYRIGVCGKCGQQTDIAKRDCNYALGMHPDNKYGVDYAKETERQRKAGIL